MYADADRRYMKQSLANWEGYLADQQNAMMGGATPPAETGAEPEDDRARR
jgi:hypothetical protein